MIASFGFYFVTLAVVACLGLALALFLGAGSQ
jgi:hypothetical protein